jgi:hypothetical protein
MSLVLQTLSGTAGAVVTGYAPEQPVTSGRRAQ